MPNGTIDITIRPLVAADAAAAAHLITELSYPTTTEEMAERLSTILALPDFAAFIAECDGNPVGMIGLQITPSFETNGKVGRIQVLVVDQRKRSMRVGRKLIAHAEAYIVSRGGDRAVLTCANRRKDAHRFYDAIGYDRTGIRFTRKL